MKLESILKVTMNSDLVKLYSILRRLVAQQVFSKKQIVGFSNQIMIDFSLGAKLKTIER